MRPDLFQSPDYYLLDELLSDEHKLVRDAARAWVKKEVSPIIEEYAQKGKRVAVHGKLINRNYLDKDGSKKQITEIELKNIIGL